MMGFPVLFHGFLTNSDTQVFNKDNVLPKIAFKGNVRGLHQYFQAQLIAAPLYAETVQYS